MSDPNIRMRFIRKKGDSKTDDLVTIERLGRDLFLCSFKDGNSKKTDSLILNDRKLFWWLRIILRLVKKDSDPFASVQFDMPLMPSILADIRTIDSFYHTILDAIEFHMDNWPVRNQPDDMPPLVYEARRTTTSV